MADFNLGAEVSMDVDPIKASARTLERELKGINQSLREQRKEFKQNEMSAEQLADMEKDLGRAIKAQEGLLTRRKKSLQDVKEEMAKSNEVTDEQRIKLQKADAAYRKAQNQLNGYTKELKDVQVASKTLGKSTDDIKGKLNSLRNEVKLSEAEFQKSSKATNDYEKHINNLSISLNKSETNIKQLEDNLKIVSELKGENSREAKKLSSEIEKERLSYSQLEVSLSKVKNEFEDVKYENSELAQSINKTEKFIDNMKGNVNALSNELKRSSSSFKGSSQEADDYKNHLQQLTNIQTKQKNVIKELEDEYKSVTAIQGTSSQQAKQLKDEIDKQRTSFTSLDTQINQVTKQYDEYRLANSQANITLGEAKRRLESYNNALEVNTVKFKNSNRSVENYQNQLNHTNATITQHKAVLESLKQRYEEVAHAQGKDSNEAEKLQREMYKEAVALEVAQSRADELSKELDEVARSQTKVALTSKLMRAGFAGSRDSMDRIATTLRSLGEITQGVVGEVMATQFANLVPIMGSVVSAGAGIGGMLTSLAGGAIGLGGAFGIGMGAINVFAGQATYALKKLEDGELALTNETRRYQSVLSSLKKEWEGLIAQNQAKIFNTLSNGINIARTSLSNLNPFLTRTAGQIEGMSGKMLNWVKTSSNAKTAFNILNTQGTQAFGHLLQGAYHFVDGTTAVFNKLSPLFVWASQGFENMALSFRKWANSVEGSKAINGFVEYTKTNLPIVGRIFGNVFAGLFNLFSAFSGHSHNVLLGIESVTEGFRKWSEELKRSDGFKQFVEYLETNGPKVWQLIKNITGVLWGLVKGMAPVASVTLSVTNAITGWMASMVNTHPMIGKILGSTVALTGAILLLLKPIFLVKGALTGMRGALLAVTGAEKLLGTQGAFATLGMKRQAIQAKITTVATKAWAVVTKAAALATRGLGLALRFMTGPIGIAITVIGALTTAIIYLWKNNETFRNFVINAWNAIKNSAVAVFGFLKPYIINIWNAIKNSTIAIWNALKNAAKVTWNAIKFAVQHPIQALKNIISGIWNFIKTNSLKTWSLIKTGILTIAKSLVSLVKASFNGLKSFFSTLWNFVKNNSLKTWSVIKNGVLKIIRSLVNGAKTVISGLKKFISTTWNAIKSISIRTWNAIKNGVINAIRSMSNGVKKIVGALKAWMSKAWNAIKNTTVKLAKGLSSGVKNTFNSLSKVTRSIFNKLKSFMSSVWRAIKNTTVKFAKSLWSGVKNTWNSLSKGTHRIFNSVKSYMNKTWNNIKNNTIRLAKALWSGVKRNWNTLKSGTTRLFNSVKSYMSRTWNSIKNNTIKLAKLLWVGVKRNWNSLKSGTSAVFSRVKSNTISKWKSMKNSMVSITSALWSKVKGTFSSMASGIKNFVGRIEGHITGMVSAVKKSLNSLIDAVNWVGGKLGVDSKIPKLSTGTEGANSQSFVSNGAINRPTLATLNDKGRGNGTGSNGHQELVQRKNGSIIAPIGKDVIFPLDKGDKVISGRNTQKLRNQGFIPKFSRGTDSGADVRKRMLRDAKKRKKHNHPTFDAGEMMGQGGFGAGGAGGAAKEAWKYVTDKTKDIGSGAKHTVKSLSDGAKKMINTTKGALGAAGTWAKEKAGDLLQYVGSPGKLVNKVLKEFGVDFSMVNGEIPKMLWDAMWKQLKEGVKALFGGWLDDASEGDGDGRYIKYLDNITTRYSPNGPPPGYPFNWAHPGIDLPYIYEKVQTPLEGKVETRNTASGFGHHIIVRAKPYDAYFGHLSKWLVKNGQHVKPGDTIGVSGNTGSSSGPHLHYEMNKHGFGSMTGHSIDPVKWLKSHNGSKGGGSKAANKWKPEIKQALKANGLPTTAAYVNAWIRQIQTESGGNAGAIQSASLHDGNEGANRARGLLQVVPTTFAANKLPGHGNIMNGLDNAMAAINYAKKRYGRTGMLQVIGHGHGYATGTNNARKGYATVFEKGGEIMNLRGGEQIIPNDVSIAAIERVINSDIFNRTQSAVYEAISRFADGIREKQQQESIEKAELRRLQTENTDIKEQNALLKAILGKMDALLNINNDINQSNQEIRDKNYFPSSKEMTRMNNENNALNAKTRLMARRR
ncbi:peptidoglycan DD-metalloendopeptidase family protein [Staphylococcus hominis]|uniref:peptidoglycan DD-metalloendopeptidase family protein n=1 Tax=Staphylococcus hominis TaxID=1290 RepID=UPI00265B83E5|nr:peptidoglycan DD-metalloendopeptidase family protein [Staphylococcus hominis]MDO0996585.1 peptidoglycan DD-metalloendopeptidase family protein [Staphylococcus hominis]